MKHALFEYQTENIGDEIQSIAARRFLPQVDAFVDRDRLGQWHPGEQTSLIMNGWYMHPPYAWPPSDDDIRPLLISMYVDQADGKVGEAFFSPEGKRYLNEHGPVGARDLSTMRLLQDHGVDSYFSGCLTLTLQRDPDIAKQDFILAVDVPQPVIDMIQAHTDRPVIQSSPYFDACMSRSDRFQLAEYFLFLYQSAHAVVTTRLHAMLPSLALETPVLLVKDHHKYDSRRYAGLDCLVHSATDVEYLQRYELFDVDDPPSNPSDYRALRERLIATASEFTGYNNDRTFRTVDFSAIDTNEAYIRLFTRGFFALNRAVLLEGDKAWLQEQNDDLRRIRQRDAESFERERQELLRQMDQLKAQLDDVTRDYEREVQRLAEVYASKTWKTGYALAAPARWAGRLFGKGNQ